MCQRVRREKLRGSLLQREKEQMERLLKAQEMDIKEARIVKEAAKVRVSSKERFWVRLL